MRVPPLVIPALVASLAPIVAQATRRRWPAGGRAWILAWCGLGLATDLVAFWLGSHGRNNLWLFYVWAPGSSALVLWALSHWQGMEIWRLTMRIAVAPFLLAWGLLFILVERASDFSSVAEPMVKLVALAAASFTLVAGSVAGRGDVLRRDWFWISGGLTLYYGVSAAVSPLAALLLERPDLLITAWGVKNGLQIVSYLLIARGMLCPTRP